MGFEVVRENIEQNQDAREEMPLISEAHNRLVSSVSGRLHEFGVQKPYDLFREVSLGQNREIARTDLIAIHLDDLYLIEVKAPIPRYERTGRELRSIKQIANNQLSRGYDFFKSTFGVLPIRIYIIKNGSGLLHHKFPPLIEDILDQLGKQEEKQEVFS